MPSVEARAAHIHQLAAQACKLVGGEPINGGGTSGRPGRPARSILDQATPQTSHRLAAGRLCNREQAIQAGASRGSAPAITWSRAAASGDRWC